MTTLGKMITPAAHRYVLELPSRNINHLHNGSKKRILADCSRRKGQRKNSIHHKVWSYWLYKDAFWFVLCTKYLSKVYGVEIQGNAMETLAGLPWWYNYLQSRYVVLQRLKSARLKLKSFKCELFQSDVLYLGHAVGKDLDYRIYKKKLEDTTEC